MRIVAVTNQDLKGMVEENKFRADLYYRLAVFPMNVPALRERCEDIPLLTVALPENIGQSALIVLHGPASNVTELSERARILLVLKETSRQPF